MSGMALTVPFLDQAQPVVSWLLACVAVVIIGIAKSGFGGGVGIVAVPLFVLAYGDPKPAVAALLPLLIAADIFAVAHHWGTWDKPNLGHLLPGAMAGIALAAGVLALFGTLDKQKRSLELAIGLICVVYPLLEVVKIRLAPHRRLRSGAVVGSGAGLAAGFVSTFAHAAGPIAAIYLLAQHLPRQAFIGTSVIFFFIVNTVKLIPYSLLGLIDTATLWAGLWLLPLIPVGTFLGARLNRVMSEGVFRAAIFVIVVLTGAKLVWG